jgi:hypothetical protein
VYQHALGYFTEDEIAEAFATTRGLASPTQLRSALKHDGCDLVAEFRALAPGLGVPCRSRPRRGSRAVADRAVADLAARDQETVTGNGWNVTRPSHP